MEKHHIYIVLTRTSTILSRLIQSIRKDEYTHAAISLDSELNQMYSFGRKNVCNPFIGRFKKEEIHSGVYGIQKEVPCVILELEVSKEQYKTVKAIIRHFKNKGSSYKYNYAGLLHNIFNVEKCREERFLCSEFVYHVLRESSIADFKISRNLVRPQDLLKIRGKVIYKGNLKELTMMEDSADGDEMGMMGARTIYG